MIKTVFALGLVSWLTACGGSNENLLSSDQDLISCKTATDCPSGAQCEIEAGLSKGVCKTGPAPKPGAGGATSGACPAGFERETEHGVSSCQRHDGSGGSGSADEGDQADDHASGGADERGVERGEGGAGEKDDDHGSGGASHHGDDDDDGHLASAGASDDHGSDDDKDGLDGMGAGGAASTACLTAADCAAGQECKVEGEHGSKTGTCEGHGGKD